MEDPVGVEVMDAIQNLVEQRLDHSSRQLKWLLVGLGCSVELNNVLQKDKKTAIVANVHEDRKQSVRVLSIFKSSLLNSRALVYATDKIRDTNICGSFFHFLGKGM